jgi:arylsulfatase A-like enzyme
VGRVLDAIERAGVKDDTLVLVVADHGEEFGEHDFFGHGQTLYEEAVHIPLIARLPAGADGPPPGSVSDPLVSLADVAPWILRLCGLQPDPRMHVEAPLGPDQLSPPGRSRLWIELDTHIARLSALREGGLKLHQLYDGRNRGLPGVPAARSAEAARLEADLDRFHDFTEAIHPRRTQSAPDLNSLSPQRRLQLLGMGYFGSAASKGGERAEALYDLSSDPRERGAP